MIIFFAGIALLIFWPTRAAEEPGGDLVMLTQTGGPTVFVLSAGIEEANDTLTVELLPANPEQSAALESMRNANRTVSIAFRHSAHVGHIQSLAKSVGPSGEVLRFEIRVVHRDWAQDEMGYSPEGKHYSADDLAKFRARLILFDERPWRDDISINDMMLKSMVMGPPSAPLRPERSPLPLIYSELGANRSLFLDAAKLVAVMFLILSGVIEVIERLDMALNCRKLSIVLRGQRHRVYVNRDPTRIEIEGTYELPGDPKGKLSVIARLFDH